MYIQNSFFSKKHLIFIFLIVTVLVGLEAEQERFNFTSSKGLKIKIIKDDDMNFLHAQLLIYYGISMN